MKISISYLTPYDLSETETKRGSENEAARQRLKEVIEDYETVKAEPISRSESAQAPEAGANIK